MCNTPQLTNLTYIRNINQPKNFNNTKKKQLQLKNIGHQNSVELSLNDRKKTIMP